MSLSEYREFIAKRAPTSIRQGFTPKPYPDMIKAHQSATLDFCLDRGKSAAFLDTGLGKSFIELEFARQCADETGKPSLILTPLAVAGQMVREGHKFGIDARQIREQSEVGAGVMVANYERLQKLDPASFGAVVLDESSILKSYGGKTVTALYEAFADTPYKLAATATPAPNDHMEIGQHAQFLDVMDSNEMLARWFIADQKQMGKYRLKGHGQHKFWEWVASWSRCATLPSDLGGDDAGYVLPEIERHVHTVHADRTKDTDGLLFRIPEMSATSFHKEKRLTIEQRCQKAAIIVFSDICAKLAGAVEEYEKCHGSLNTLKTEGANITKTKNTESAESLREERQKKTKNTCASITKKTKTNLEGLESNKTHTMRQGVKDTQATQNMQKQSGSLSGGETQSSGVMSDCGQPMEFLNLTMSECFHIRDFVAKFVEQDTKKKGGRDFTSITATKTDTSEGYCAHRVTRLLEKCAMMLIDSEAQYDTLRKILLEPVLIFVQTNEEQKRLEDIFGGSAFSVKGSDTPEKKEGDIISWCDGVKPWLISKSSIVGFGMNFQHCWKVIFASIDFSYEKFYQSVRRVWRFGQDNIVNCHIVVSDTEASVLGAVMRKSEDHDTMKREMAKAMKRAQLDSGVMIKYERDSEFALPEWL